MSLIIQWAETLDCSEGKIFEVPSGYTLNITSISLEKCDMEASDRVFLKSRQKDGKLIVLAILSQHSPFQSTNLRFGELDNISLVQSGPAKIHLRGHFEQNHEIIENFSSFEDIEESDEFDGDNLFDYFLGSSEGVDVYGSNLDQWEEYSSIGESSGPVIEELPTEDESDEPIVENEASKTRQKRHKKKAKHSKTK